jgi:hypothetical protein
MGVVPIVTALVAGGAAAGAGLTYVATQAAESDWWRAFKQWVGAEGLPPIAPAVLPPPAAPLTEREMAEWTPEEMWAHTQREAERFRAGQESVRLTEGALRVTGTPAQPSEKKFPWLYVALGVGGVLLLTTIAGGRTR